MNKIFIDSNTVEQSVRYPFLVAEIPVLFAVLFMLVTHFITGNNGTWVRSSCGQLNQNNKTSAKTQ